MTDWRPCIAVTLHTGTSRYRPFGRVVKGSGTSWHPSSVHYLEWTTERKKRRGEWRKEGKEKRWDQRVREKEREWGAEEDCLPLLFATPPPLPSLSLPSSSFVSSKPSNMLLTDSWDELVLMDLGSAASAECTITSRSGCSCVTKCIPRLLLHKHNFPQLGLLRSLHPCCRREALALQELCAQTCSAQYRWCVYKELMYVNWQYMFLCRAPELFEVPSNCTITAKTDVWSLGCSLYAAAFGETLAL